MERELEQLCSRISLSEKEKIGLSIEGCEVADARVQGARCLMGKICMEKGINKEAFKSILTRLWRTTGRVIFRELQEKIWLFEFVDEADKRRVMVGRPWSFDRHILMLNEFEGGVSPS